jgi:GT2 family glycosyltransferase/glycosyltransferase involved in cell wall biosynthesis
MLGQALHLAKRIVTWPFRYGRLPNRQDLTRWRLWLNARLHHRLPHGIFTKALWTVHPYEWHQRNNAWNTKSQLAAARILSGLKTLPRFSIVMPVFNPPLRWLERALESVRQQAYPHWEVCIADDASTDPAVRQYLQKLECDSRFRIAYRSENGHISRASNAAAALASGDYLVLLDQDDELTPDCLLELACAAQDETADVIYSDEDKIDTRGHRFEPYFKPDWSPELLLSCNYICHVFAIRRTLFNDAGGFRPEFNGAQDHDLALRLTEKARSIVHVPKVLYHWRTLPTSTASNGKAKTYAFDAGTRAVQEAIDRRQFSGRARWLEKYRERQFGGYEIDFPDDGPSVTIIIPTKNRCDMLRRCVKSLEKTTYRNFDVVIIDNESDDPETLQFLNALDERHRVERVTNPDGRFNYARLHNQVVPQIRSDYLLLLNNDTEVIRPEWLSQMVGYASFPGVGAVGARLLYPDGAAQHVGVAMGIGGMVGHVRKHRRPGDPVSFHDEVLAANYGIVTAACMLVKRSLYEEVGGLDQERFAVAYNDVDFCLKLHARGLRCVYAPRAELYHYESVSRGGTVHPRELQAFRQTWDAAKPDPYYNPNLSPHCDFQQIGTRRQLPARYEREIPLKLGVALPDLACRGTTMSALEMTEALTVDGDIRASFYSLGDGLLAHRLTSMNVERLSRVPEHAPRHVIARQVDEFASVLRQQRHDVIWAHGLAAFPIAAAAHKASIPLVWTLRHPVDWQKWFRESYPSFSDAVYDLMARTYQFVAASYEIYHFDLEKLALTSAVPAVRPRGDLEKLAATVSPEEARRRLGVEPAQPLVTVIGPMDASRRPATVVEACVGALRAGLGDVRFVFTGCESPTIRNILVAAAEEYASYFSFLPTVSDALLYIRASDLVVQTKKKSSCSRSVQEAFALDVPVVTTPYCGFDSYLVDGVNVLRWEDDEPASLTQAIRRGLTDEVLRQRLRVEGRRTLDALPPFTQVVHEYRSLLLEAALCDGPSVEG